MRPIRKGVSPVAGDFNKYEDAKPELVSRLGLYCSYCERKIVALSLLQNEPNSVSTKDAIAMMAKQAGFFSIWMKVFNAYPDMKVRFIQTFEGTEESSCFDMTTGNSIVPAPNSDRLIQGGKV